MTFRTVRSGAASRPVRWRLGIALVPTADEATAAAERPVGDTHIAGVVTAAADPETCEQENPEAFHDTFDARANGLFTAPSGLKTEQFR